MNRAILLDRDGTLNYDSKEYVKGVDEFELFDFTPQAIKNMKEKGFLIIVITNQSGIARGYFTETELDKMHTAMKQEVEKFGGEIDDIFYCPHHPDDNCKCRKPGTKNIKKAAKKFDLDLSNSYFIGDSKKDIQAGAKEDCKTVFVNTGIQDYTEQEIEKWRIKPDFIFQDILEFTHEVLM